MATARKKSDGGAKKGGPRAPRRTARRVKREEAARGALEARAAAIPLEALPPELAELARAVVSDGGAVLGALRDPLAGRPLLLAALPLDRVDPTPYQRKVSPAHVEKLADAIVKTGVYLDPIVAFRDARAGDGGRYHTPNGGHRTEAMRRIGARAVTALLVPDEQIAYRILALNTEKAHNLKERAQEVSAMARSLEPLGGRESDYAAYFEEAALVTLGFAYEKRPRLSGGAWHPIVRRLETFSDEPLRAALARRQAHADELLALDDRVTALVDALKARGLQSPYLRNFVVARINPLRFIPRGKPKKGAEAEAAPVKVPSWDATIAKMRGSLDKFDPGRINPGDLAHAGGPPDESD